LARRRRRRACGSARRTDQRSVVHQSHSTARPPGA